MVELQQKSIAKGVVGEAVWLSAMRRAGLSKEEIDRVVTATATLDRPTDNGDGIELVPVKEAAHRISRSENTVRSWIRLGHLQTVEIRPPSDHANGPWVHVDMADVEGFDKQSKPGDPDKGELITLKEAAERFDIPVGRLQGWYKSGHLPTHGSRIGRGGKALLVDIGEVAGLITNPPRPTGRPRKKHS